MNMDDSMQTKNSRLKILSTRSTFVEWITYFPHIGETILSSSFVVNGKTTQLKITGTADSARNGGINDVWYVYLKSTLDTFVTFYIKSKVGFLIHLSCTHVFGKTGDYESLGALSRARILQYLSSVPEDPLTVIFEFGFHSKLRNDIVIKTESRSTQVYAAMHLSSFESFSDEIQILLNNSEYSDAVLKCSNRKYLVNRAVLSARSEVFAAMFRNPMSEKKTGVIEIKDMKPSILEKFIRFIYSGKLNELSMESAFVLYESGEKYAIDSLKRVCVSFILDNLNEKYVCKVLHLADTFGDNELLQSAMCFAVSQNGFLKSTEWNDFAKSNAVLAVRVYQKFHSD